MAYTPYYSGGWQNGEQGGTPMTAAALNNMEDGIGAALPKSGGTMTGNIDMGQNAANMAGYPIKWTSSDGTEFSIRPYSTDLQIIRKPSESSSIGTLTFKSNGTIAVDSPANWRTALGAAASSDVSNLIIKQSFTLSTSVSLNSLASYTYDVPYTTPTGYKPVAALEGRVEGGVFAVTVNLRANTSNCAAYVINASSSVRTGTGITVDILFIRDI